MPRFPARKSVLLTIMLLPLLAGGALAQDRFSDHFLRSLYDRSDLVIDATVLEYFGFGSGWGPAYPSEDKISFVEYLVPVHLNRVFKGSFSSTKPFHISITLPLSGKRQANPPKKGDRFFFFLEDRVKREPQSYEAINDEVVNFRTFDLWLWRIPVSDALAVQLSKWQKEEIMETRQTATATEPNPPKNQ